MSDDSRMEIIGDEYPKWEIVKTVVYTQTAHHMLHHLDAEEYLCSIPFTEMGHWTESQIVSLVDGPEILQIRIRDCLLSQIISNGFDDTAMVLGIEDRGLLRRYHLSSVTIEGLSAHHNDLGEDCVNLIVTLTWPMKERD